MSKRSDWKFYLVFTVVKQVAKSFFSQLLSRFVRFKIRNEYEVVISMAIFVIELRCP